MGMWAELIKRAGASSSGGEDKSHLYVPPPSVGHEIGIIFGGIGAMLLTMFLFWAWWQMYLKHEEKKEQDRIEGLRQRGLLKEQRPPSPTLETGQEKPEGGPVA